MTEDLEVPAYRERIIRQLAGIASEAWTAAALAGPQRGGPWFYLEEIQLLLFDCLDFDYQPEASIGVALYNKAEVQAVLKFANLLEAMDDEVAEDTDYAIVTHRRWPELVQSAKDAVAVLKQRE